MDRQAGADRSQGEIHPLGNPHYHFSPANILAVAQGMTAALTRLDPAKSQLYR